MKSINVEAGFCFCGGWNFSKSVIVDSTFIREMRVLDNAIQCRVGKGVKKPELEETSFMGGP